ncbi:MAG: hypothetical protein AAGD13_19070 [Pseudomonadota bacterium]
MAKTLVYTVTNGTAGTGYLRRFLEGNLRDAEIHGDRAGWLDLGVNCPDASHLTRFNTMGNLPEIRSFWRRKLKADMASSQEILVDLTHLHAKAGLVENLDLVPEDVQIVLIHLRHNIRETVWTIHNRCDFRNSGFTWVFALDPNYRNVMVPSGQFAEQGMAGLALWYVVEMRVRAAFYKRLTAEMPNVTYSEIWLAELVNRLPAATQVLETIGGERPDDVKPAEREETQPIRPGGQEIQKGSAAEKTTGPKAKPAGNMFGQDVRDNISKMVDRFKWDAEELAEGFFSSGRRLGDPALGRSASHAVH